MVQKGMEGVEAAESALGYIQGHQGILQYRGYNIQDLAKHSHFEETTYLLLYGHLPMKKKLEDFHRRLRQEYDIPKEMYGFIRKLLKQGNPMQSLRTAVSALAHYDADAENIAPEATERISINLIAKFPTLIANIEHARNGKPFLKPKKEYSIAENFLFMLHGKKPVSLAAKTLDLCLVLHAEHGFNASTFAARVATSTLTDFYSAIVAAIGTLKGPLHGGANEQVMHMLQQIKKVERAEAYVMEKLAKHEKIPGIGHRVYKVKDPRTHILQEYAGKLCKETGKEEYYKILLKIEEVMLREKNLYPNVDFFSGLVYDALSIPMHLYPSLFAMSRIAGWCAHVREQYADNRLIRPIERYIGPRDKAYQHIIERV